MTESDRRNVQRFHLKLPLIVRYGQEAGEKAVEKNGDKVSTATKDVSSRGVYFFLPKDVGQGAPVEIVMTLPHELTMAGPVQVRCLGRVHRSEKLDSGELGVVATIERYEFLRGENEE
ncbi:MAG TPA: PilZ domain-containing protein [Candidatus Acidoferrales bacterium]|nr:PilZ domain-containing protein [Candidatus Acidoferrales bacterium]